MKKCGALTHVQHENIIIHSCMNWTGAKIQEWKESGNKRRPIWKIRFMARTMKTERCVERIFFFTVLLRRTWLRLLRLWIRTGKKCWIALINFSQTMFQMKCSDNRTKAKVNTERNTNTQPAQLDKAELDFSQVDSNKRGEWTRFTVEQKEWRKKKLYSSNDETIICIGDGTIEKKSAHTQNTS